MCCGWRRGFGDKKVTGLEGGVRPDQGQLCEMGVLGHTLSTCLLTSVRTLSVRIQASFVTCTWSWVGLLA